MTTVRPTVMHIAYQRLWFDYDVRDGSYTPKQLRAVKLRVQHDAKILRYALTWPGGVTEPPTREAPASVQMARWHQWRQGRNEKVTKR